MEFPSQCPHCGKDVAENLQQVSHPTKSGNFYYRAETHLCFHCSEPIFVLREAVDEQFKKGSRISQYVPLQPTRSFQFPKHIPALSPSAAKIFSQAYQAREEGLNTLVGAGFRSALEWLLFDYCIKIKGINPVDIHNKTLAQLSNMATNNGSNHLADACNTLIRKYGNGQVHRIPINDVTEDEIVIAFKTLFDIIEAEIIVINANNRLNKLPEII